LKGAGRSAAASGLAGPSTRASLRMTSFFLCLFFGGFALGVGGDVAGEVPEEEFAGEIANGFAAEIQDGVIEHARAHANAGVRMPGADDDSRDAAADEVGVGRMPVLVVAALQEGGRDGMPGTADDAAIGHDEVARIFFEERVKQNAGNNAADESTAVVRGVKLKVAAGAGAIFGVGSGGVLNAGADASGAEEDWIGSGTDGELELLAHGEWSSVPDVAGVVVGKDAEDALMQFVVKLDFGDLLFGECDGGVGGGAGDGKSDFGKLVGLAGFEMDIGDAIGLEAG